MAKRVMGKASFAQLQDMSGRFQLFLQRDALPENRYQEFKSWDVGDIICTEGVLFKTKTGELSVRADDLRILTKSLRPLPEKFHGLTDQEIRYRKRYLDLIMNEESRKTFVIRSQVVQFIREFMNRRNFLEVGNANDAADTWRRSGASVYNPSQRARHATVFAHRARAVFKTISSRRF